MRLWLFWGLVGLFSMIFATWLMWHTLSFDSVDQTVLVSERLWSDFGGHIPLIRSFTYGHNWPPQNPLFPGEPIRYHFSFFALVGLLERLGVRLDWAMNVPSVLGLAGLMVMIVVLASRLFSSRLAGLVALVLFLFNGSLTFVKYFAERGWTWAALKEIPINSRFVSFGPWDGGLIAASWTLNIFTNQRHLAPAMALGLLVVYLVNFRKVSPIAVSLLMAATLFLNQAIFVGIALYLLIHFIFISSCRKTLFFSGLLTLPWIGLSLLLVRPSGGIRFHPGFLIADKFSLQNLWLFWVENLGVHLLLIPLGLVWASPRARIIGVWLVILFLIPNLWQLSPDMFNNHKLFNLFIAVAGMFSAFAITKLFRKIILAPLAMILLVLVTLSGVIDFIPLTNDRQLALPASLEVPDIAYVVQHTQPNDIFLNSVWFFHPASLAGRPIFNGYTYFTWSHGYDSYGRETILKAIYRAPTLAAACSLLTSNNIAYVELHRRPEDYLQPNWALWNSLTPSYTNPQSGFSFYKVSEICARN